MQLIGLARIGRDAELKQINGGQSVLNVPLAYNYGKEKLTQWVECTMFGDRAAKVAQYFTKGTALVVFLDNVHVETYPKKDGTTGVRLVGILQSFEFAGKSAGGSSGEPAPKTPMQAVQEMSEDIPF